MNKIKFVYFDLANTLVHQPEFYTSIFNFLEARNFSIDPIHLKKTHKILAEETQFPDKTDKEFYLQFNLNWMKTLGLNSDLEFAEQIFMVGKGKNWIPFEDTSVLAEISIQKGIISNWDKSLPEKLDFFFNTKFESIVGSALVGFQKPDPRIFLYAISQCGFNPEEILMVGDSIRLDIIPAKNLGIQSVLIDRENIFPNFTGLRINSLNELISLL